MIIFILKSGFSFLFPEDENTETRGRFLVSVAATEAESPDSDCCELLAEAR